MTEDVKARGKRLAAFGFRSLPPRPGSSGADKYAEELYSRLAERGYEVTGYNRVHSQAETGETSYRGIRIFNIKTPRKPGVEALVHSAKVTAHIIRHRTGDVVHVQNGGNGLFILILRAFGKSVYLTEDGAEWERGKWPWYARLYLRIMRLLTAYVPNAVIFDNVFLRDKFEQRFNRRYEFIPYGSDPTEGEADTDALESLGLRPGEYFLFVGRFIPEKGLQYLIPAFEQLATEKKLVLVGGAPEGSEFADRLRRTSDERILFPGYMYGADVHTLMRHAYAYVQPSDLEGLSPVILENMGMGVPIICSDIEENLYVVGDTTSTFRKGSVPDLARVMRAALENPRQLAEDAQRAKTRAKDLFSWEAVTDRHVDVFFGATPSSAPRESTARAPR